MRGNVIDLGQARAVSKEVFDRWTRRMVPEEGDILLAREAPVGPVVRIPAGGRIAAGQRTTHLRADPEVIHPRYLYYLLISKPVQNAIAANSMGSTVPHLRVADVKALPLPPIPDLLMQGAIAEVLGALDDKIAANRVVVEIANELAAALVRSESANRVCSLDSVAQSVARGVAPKYTDNGYLVLNQKCIRNGAVDVGLGRRTSVLPRAAEKIIEADDVLVNSTGTGTLGRAARWIRPEGQVSVDSHVTVVRFDPAKVDPAYAGVVLAGMECDIAALAEGSTGQTELRRELLSSLQLRLPTSLDEQRKVGDRIRAIDKMAVARAEESVTLARTRNELLPLLMDGRITVKGLEKRVEGVV